MIVLFQHEAAVKRRLETYLEKPLWFSNEHLIIEVLKNVFLFPNLFGSITADRQRDNISHAAGTTETLMHDTQNKLSIFQLQNIDTEETQQQLHG